MTNARQYPPYRYFPQNEPDPTQLYDRLSLPEDPAILSACPRNIWSAWLGYGRLIGHVGMFDVAPDRPAVLHCCSFQVLN